MYRFRYVVLHYIGSSADITLLWLGHHEIQVCLQTKRTARRQSSFPRDQNNNQHFGRFQNKTDFIRSHQYWFLLNHHSAIKVTEKDREAISLSRQVEDGSNFSLRKKNSCLNKIGSVKKNQLRFLGNPIWKPWDDPLQRQYKSKVEPTKVCTTWKYYLIHVLYM